MLCLNKKYYLKILKLTKKASICLLILLIFLISCGKKLDPTLENYLPPDQVGKLNLTAIHDRVLITWNYPDKSKSKIESFLIERESRGEKKSLGYYDKNTTSLEDRDFIFGETYKYSIFAISPKGIYSKPTEAEITPQKLPDVENIDYKITSEGVLLSWNNQNSLLYNIYRINHKDEKIKIGSTDKNSFLDTLTYQPLSSLKTGFKEEITYIITTYFYFELKYMESKGTQIKVPMNSFVPSKPTEIFWSINEQGVYISWKEVPEIWIKDYKIYRKTIKEQDFKFIGETKIPFFLDTDYNIHKTKLPIHYKITTEGPLRESESVEIRIEVQFG